MIKPVRFIVLICICLFSINAFGISNETVITHESEPLFQTTVTGYLTAIRWSPYVVGACIGVLSWLSFLLSDKAIGVSTAYVRSCGMIEKAIHPQKTEQKIYYQKFRPVIDWEWMLVVGLIIGAFISAITSGDFSFDLVPSVWQEHFGDNIFLRWLVAFVGGMVLAIGARWAGGCTSGHGISGTSQLVVSSWIAAICFFVGGIVTSMLLYKIIL